MNYFNDIIRPSQILLLTKIVCLVVLLFVPAGCMKKKEKQKAKAPVPVMIATVEQRTVPVVYRSMGNVEAFNSVPVRAQVNGVVSKVHFSEGQDVQKGDPLFTIDPAPFNASLKQAEANLARDLAQARNAEEQTRRYASLLKDGIVTQEQYDQLKANADAMSAAVASDRAAAENAKIQLSYCFIRSPLSGRTGSLFVNVGTLVKANDTAALVTVNQVSPIYVSFTVPEKELTTIKSQVGSGRMTVEAIVPNDPKGPVRGTVSFLDNAVDAATGTIRLKGSFQNAERRLWPGQFVNVVLTLGKRSDAVVAPAASVQTGQQGQFVFVITADRKVEQRSVAASITEKDFTVIDKGLAPGELVVTDGLMNLTSGTMIEIKSPKQVLQNVSVKKQ